MKKIQLTNNFNNNNYFPLIKKIKYKIIKYIIIIKIIFIFINCLQLFYFYLSSLFNHNSYVDIDNIINITYYENNINYSNYSTNIKLIAIYVPNFYSINNSNLVTKKDFNCQKGDKNFFDNYNLANNQVIKKQIELAKSHGIYGFAIYYYWFCGKTIFDKPLNIIYENQIQFNYMLIWKNEMVINENNVVLLEEKYEGCEEKFFEDIKKYLIDSRYIKIDGKSVIGIYNSTKITQLKKVLLLWRKKAKELNIGELFIISNINTKNTKELNNNKLFDSIYRIPPYDLLENKIIKNTRDNFYYYYGLLYSNIISENKIGNLSIYKGSMLELDNPLINKRGKAFRYYYPELFYIMNKILIKWTKDNYNLSNRIIFINAWNNYFEGAYLEPEFKYGFGSINSLSKALFDLPYNHMEYNLLKLKKICLVAVQAHIFYEDLIVDIINKTNNIPVKFDLYITTDNYSKMKYIKNYTNRYSKSDNLIIQILDNKGRDVLPLLIQLGDVIHKYKYFCHIHSKKHITHREYGRKWRIYLYENLLGSSEKISEILADFENNNKLGFIYPENFYECVKPTMYTGKSIKQSMNSLIGKLFPGHKIGNKYFDFPAGNMFWARSKAVHQIFKINLKNDVPSEKGAKTILWAIERIWLFIVKLNGFFYKKYLYYI